MDVLLTFSPFGVQFNDLVHVNNIFESLLLQLPNFIGVAALIGAEQYQVQNHRPLPLLLPASRSGGRPLCTVAVLSPWGSEWNTLTRE